MFTEANDTQNRNQNRPLTEQSHAWWNTQIDIVEENKTYLNYQNLNYSDNESTTEENLDIYETGESLEPPTPTPETETMADGNTSGTTKSREMKKKMKAPTPFSGKREDLQKFLQEIKIYLLANGDVYPSNMDKVLFVFSYMSEGDANSWKEEFFETAEQTVSQNGGQLDLGTYNNLIVKITTDFSPYVRQKMQYTRWKRWGWETTIPLKNMFPNSRCWSPDWSWPRTMQW